MAASYDESENVVLMYGDPLDGLTFVGPFESHEDAIEWASNEVRDASWWVTRMLNPTKGENE